MNAMGGAVLSRKRLRDIGEQLANDRKLEILTYAADRERFTVAELKDSLGIPHTTAHEYCRDLARAGLIERVQGKPAAYAPIDFEVKLSLDEISSAVESESQTLSYVYEKYGEEAVEDVLDVWDRVEAGELTYREASAEVGMKHVDFLRTAAELDLLSR